MPPTPSPKFVKIIMESYEAFNDLCKKHPALMVVGGAAVGQYIAKGTDTVVKAAKTWLDNNNHSYDTEDA